MINFLGTWVYHIQIYVCVQETQVFMGKQFIAIRGTIQIYIFCQKRNYVALSDVYVRLSQC